jgi:hypothetical protein
MKALFVVLGLASFCASGFAVGLVMGARLAGQGVASKILTACGGDEKVAAEMAQMVGIV